MPRIPFQKPKKVEWEILSERYGRLVAEPFEKGYALTVGNSLRRTLLAIIPGAAVTWARIAGVGSADTPIPGVKESTADVLLNLKRLELAKAIAKQPSLLLLDEIAGGLTDAECDELLRILSDIHARGATIVWVEHVIHALKRLATRLAVLHIGSVIVEGAPGAVLADDRVKQVYLGA